MENLIPLLTTLLDQIPKSENKIPTNIPKISKVEFDNTTLFSSLNEVIKKFTETPPQTSQTSQTSINNTVPTVSSVPKSQSFTVDDNLFTTNYYKLNNENFDLQILKNSFLNYYITSDLSNENKEKYKNFYKENLTTLFSYFNPLLLDDNEFKYYLIQTLLNLIEYMNRHTYYKYRLEKYTSSQHNEIMFFLQRTIDNFKLLFLHNANNLILEELIKLYSNLDNFTIITREIVFNDISKD